MLWNVQRLKAAWRTISLRTSVTVLRLRIHTLRKVMRMRLSLRLALEVLRMMVVRNDAPPPPVLLGDDDDTPVLPPDVGAVDAAAAEHRRIRDLARVDDDD